MSRLLPFLVLALLLPSGCGRSPRLPSITSYKSRQFIRVAADLQAYGRDEGAAKLKRLAASEEELAVIVLCRMLFRKRAGSEFRRPMIGAGGFVGLTFHTDWPLEPIEVVDGVPFLITRGYALAGKPESPSAYLSYVIEHCDWNPEPIRERTAAEMQEALQKLLKSPKFKKGLESYDLNYLSSQIE